MSTTNFKKFFSKKYAAKTKQLFAFSQKNSIIKTSIVLFCMGEYIIYEIYPHVRSAPGEACQ